VIGLAEHDSELRDIGEPLAAVEENPDRVIEATGLAEILRGADEPSGFAGILPAEPGEVIASCAVLALEFGSECPLTEIVDVLLAWFLCASSTYQ
jgi:hypothetical protein